MIIHRSRDTATPPLSTLIYLQGIDFEGGWLRKDNLWPRVYICIVRVIGPMIFDIQGLGLNIIVDYQM